MSIMQWVVVSVAWSLAVRDASAFFTNRQRPGRALLALVIEVSIWAAVGAVLGALWNCGL